MMHKLKKIESKLKRNIKLKINSNQGQSKFDYQTFSMTVWSFIGQNCLQIKEAFARLFENNDDDTIKKKNLCSTGIIRP